MKNQQFLLLCLFSFWLSPMFAQEIRTNERGEKIIVYPDGTWQPFTNFGVPKDALFDPKDSPSYQSSEIGEKYPIFDGQILPMNNVYVSTDEDARKIFVRRSQIAQEAVNIADQRAQEAAQQRETLEQELRNAQSRGASKDDLTQLNIRLNAARQTERETAQEALQSRRDYQQADELTRKGDYLGELEKITAADIEPSKNSELLLEDFYQNIVALDESTGNVRNINRIQNQETCKTAFEGTDEISKQWRRDIQQEYLFSHTDDRLRVYLKDKEYLRCEGFLTTMGGFRYLSLQFSFAYPNAREAYGFIEKGSILIVKLLNGEFVTLTAGRMDKGSYDTEAELLTYRVHYPIDRAQLNTLRRGELDTMIMFWSSGYEEYEVYNLDFFTNQITCLEK